MSSRARLLLDGALVAALLVANNPAWTGISVHEWLAIALITPLLVHLIINWDWAVHTVMNFVEKARNASRVNLIVDTLLFLSTVAVMVSGLVVSTALPGLFGFTTSPSVIWYVLHSLSADATILMMLVHLGLHWRWIARTVGRLVRPSGSVQPRPAAVPVRSVTNRGIPVRSVAVRSVPIRTVSAPATGNGPHK